MSQKNKTLTIGITAYNESRNIRLLLKSLISQKEIGYSLEKIIVISDGSKDALFHEVRAVSDKRIELIQYMHRRGKPIRLNEISQRNTSDILVVVDADVVPATNEFLSKLVAKFNDACDVGIVSGAVVPVQAETFFESVINSSVVFKRKLYESISNQENIYLCHGRVRAFSRKFLQSFQWDNAVCEDAFSFLFCKSLGFGFKYALEAEVLYRSPQTLYDHMSQSMRFYSGRARLEERFGKRVVESAFSIPFWSYAKHTARYFISKPHLATCYVGIMWFVRLKLLWQKRSSVTWDVSVSSKYVVKEV